ncbi:MAG: hypothetical protein AAGD06_05615 [Acidobacteriota bacterium]
MRQPRAPQLSILGTLLLVALCAVPLSAEETSPRDPVIQGVLDLLSAEVSEEVVLKWLDASAGKPAVPSAADLVALAEAGASDALLGRLLDRASAPVPPAGTRPNQTPSQGAPAPATPAPATPAPTTPVPATPVPATLAPVRAPAKADPAAQPIGEVPVQFSMSYVPHFFEDEPTWDLYVYLDGRPLTYVGDSSVIDVNTLEFRQYLVPGRHVLRVTQERHVRGRRGDLRHEVRVADLEWSFDLAEAMPAEVEIRFRQSFLSQSDPLSFRFEQGAKIDVDEDRGGTPDGWPELCETIETMLDGEPSRSERRRLSKCVRWGDLWPDLDVPPRDEVREALARFDYRPVPKSGRLD